MFAIVVVLIVAGMFLFICWIKGDVEGNLKVPFVAALGFKAKERRKSK
jgi:hypothetical protein